MKQTITRKQIEELNDEGRKKLIEWWKKSDLDYMSNYVVVLDSGEFILLLSIGQMMQFLREKNNNGFYRIHFSSQMLRAEVLFHHYEFDEFDKKYESEELCDSLWKPVKEDLNG